MIYQYLKKGRALLLDNNIIRVLNSFSEHFCKILKSRSDPISEIRIRSNKPVVVYISCIPYTVTQEGDVLPADKHSLIRNDCITFSSREIKNAVARICEYSIYKYQSDINNGFVTVCGGHRIGICGTAVINDGRIKTISDISSVNIRIAHEFIGCSRELLKKTGVKSGFLICGVPSSGKTTLLRDIGRTLSVEVPAKVSIVDERGEIAARFAGESSFDTGLCDVYSGYPKNKAIIDAIRTMSPDYIICDELTGDDVQSVRYTLNYGVKMIASLHCDSLESALSNNAVKNLINTKAFEKIVFLDNHYTGKLRQVVAMEDMYAH